MSYLQNKWTVLLALFVIVTGDSGCNAINPEEEIPTYVHVDSFHFDEDDLHDIKSVWAYYNNNPVGAFDLPATIPVITTGDKGELQLVPGITVNGRNERPSIYPYYTPYIVTLESQPGKIIDMVPVTRFYDSIRRYTISEFEAGITKFSRWGGTTGLVVVSADSLRYEGTGTGAVFLSSSADSSIDSTSTSFPITPGIAFIEITYKSTVPFVLGMQSILGGQYSTSPTYLAGVNPAGEEWRKFYLNLTAFINQYQGDTYNMFIKTSAPAEGSSGRLLIDNITLITF